MNEPLISPHLASRGYALFAARQQLDSLLRNYVDELLSSHEHYEDAVNMLRSVFESLTEALLVYDREGKVILANQKAIGIIGEDPKYWTVSQIFSRYRLFKLDGTTPIRMDEVPYTFASKGIAHSIEAITYGKELPPDGMTVRLTAAPITNEKNEVTGVVGTCIDLTDSKRLERQRNSLATLIAHDIKNHLAATGMTMTLLKSRLAAKAYPSALKLIKDIKQANNRFLDIADALLDLYSTDPIDLESGRVLVNIAEILPAAIALSSTTAETGGVQVRLIAPDNLPRVRGLPTALRQAFHNLIHNSIEASRSGTTVEVRAAATARIVTVTITDHGSGMPAELVSKILDRSRPVSSLPTATGSTGFGLYLSRVIFEAHHARLSCHSRLDKGTTFTVEFAVSHGQDITG